MAINALIEATAPAAIGSASPFYFDYATERSVAEDPIFQVWKGPRSSSSNKVFELTQEWYLRVGDGTTAIPSYGFIDDTDTGLSRRTSGVTAFLELLIDGTPVLSLTKSTTGCFLGPKTITTHDGSLTLHGGGSAAVAQGAWIKLFGADHASYASHLAIRPGTGGRVSIGGTDSISDPSPLVITATQIGFFTTTTTAAQQTVTGSRGGNAALASLLTALNYYGLIVNSTTA